MSQLQGGQIIVSPQHFKSRRAILTSALSFSPTLPPSHPYNSTLHRSGPQPYSGDIAMAHNLAASTDTGSVVGHFSAPADDNMDLSTFGTVPLERPVNTPPREVAESTTAGSVFGSYSGAPADDNMAMSTIGTPAPIQTANTPPGASATAQSELQNSAASRSSSPTVSETSSHETHISSNIRPVLQIPPFVPVDTNNPTVHKNNNADAESEPNNDHEYEQSSDDEKPFLPAINQNHGPDHSSLPQHLQDLLGGYYKVNGTASPPPCAINKIKQSELKGRRTGRNPLKFVNQKGERLTASCLPIGFNNKFVHIVQGKTQQAVIIKFHKTTPTAAQKASAYHVWNGIKGFTSSASIWKVRDDNSDISNVQPATPTMSTPHATTTGSAPAANTTVSTPVPDTTGSTPSQPQHALSNCRACRERHKRCDKALPSCTSCLELGLTCRYNESAIPSPNVASVEVVVNTNSSSKKQDKKRARDDSNEDFGTTKRARQAEFAVNVTFLNGTRERTRPYAHCDDVKKLYMQATAAGLFESMAASVNIPFLLVKVGEKKVPVVKGDDEDFEVVEGLVAEAVAAEEGEEVVVSVEATD